ncbi:PilW family protein [Rheinheimera sp. F8]|uniref:PilW family protein n=1 Tax=Rheinheimera sp. F8 TaxID=1763998 RepID=UPI001AD8180F|nr:PilW family protein [Rheinheimera sp. F8]
MMKRQTYRANIGFTLTELMIALLLGSFLVAGVVGVYVSNIQTAQVQQRLMQSQQSSQVSFQLLSRDAMHAGFSGCGNMITQRVVNVLNPPLAWWAVWTAGIQGHEQGAVPQFAGAGIPPVAGTDGVQLMYGRGTSASIVSHNVTAVPPLVINQNVAGIVANDIVLACDSKMAVIFQVTAIAGNNISHAVGAGGPGNASLNFGFGANGVNFQQSLAADAGTVMPLETVGWFVGTNADGNSLYRVALVAGQMRAEEILPGVENLQVQYLSRDTANYVDANAVPDWEQVVALRATLTLANDAKMPVAAGLRTFTQVINLRNH